jgi:hypothetical protein
LTRKGEATVLAYGSESVLIDALKVEENLPTYKEWQQIVSYLDRKTAIKVLRLTGQLNLGSKTKASFAKTFLSALFEFSDSEFRDLWKAAKNVESSRKLLLQIAETLQRELSKKGGEKQNE